jgi:hypothetical protein
VQLVKARTEVDDLKGRVTVMEKDHEKEVMAISEEVREKDIQRRVGPCNALGRKPSIRVWKEPSGFVSPVRMCEPPLSRACSIHPACRRVVQAHLEKFSPRFPYSKVG